MVQLYWLSYNYINNDNNNIGAVNGRGAGCCCGQTHPMGIYPLLICILLGAWNEEVSGSCEHKHLFKQNVSFLIPG